MHSSAWGVRDARGARDREVHNVRGRVRYTQEEIWRLRVGNCEISGGIECVTRTDGFRTTALPSTSSGRCTAGDAAMCGRSAGGPPNGSRGTSDQRVICGNVSEGCLKTIPHITSRSNPPADALSASAPDGFPPWESLRFAPSNCFSCSARERRK